MMCSYGPPHMTGQMQNDQLEHTCSSYVRILDVAMKTGQRRWTIGRSGERGSGISVLAARHDDDDVLYIFVLLYEYYIIYIYIVIYKYICIYIVIYIMLYMIWYVYNFCYLYLSLCIKYHISYIMYSHLGIHDSINWSYFILIISY